MITLADLVNRVRSYDLGPIVMTNGFLIPETNEKSLRRYTLQYAAQLAGPAKWKISDGSCVYSKKEKEFVYEPIPSSRTTKFIKDTRFNTIAEAVDAINEYRKEKTALYLSKGLTYWHGVV